MLQTYEKRLSVLGTLKFVSLFFAALAIVSKVLAFWPLTSMNGLQVLDLGGTMINLAVLWFAFKMMNESVTFSQDGSIAFQRAIETHTAVSKLLDSDETSLPERDDTTGGHYIV